MLQNKFEMPLDLAVKNSKLFNYYLFVILILAVISIFISDLPFYLQLLSLGLLMILFRFVYMKFQRNKITCIHLSSDDKWKIELNNRDNFDAELDGECIVTYYITWLNFKVTSSFGRKKIFHLLLLSDSMDKNKLRQLRVRLRFLGNREENEVKKFI